MRDVVRGALVTPEGVVDDGAVVVDDGVITWVGDVAEAGAAGVAEAVQAVPAAPDRYVLPGLVDLHDHGGGGASFPDATSVEVVRTGVAEHRAHGTHHLLGSLVTASPETLRERVTVLADAADEGLVAGIHLEGPFLSTTRCGAQDPDLIIDGDADLTRELLALGRGHVVTMTVAPETPNLLGPGGVLEALVEGGALPSWGHTDADAVTMRTAAEAAAAALAARGEDARSRRATVTHLCNGMRPMHHRDPGPIPTALAMAARGELVVELVADGTHLAPELVREVFEMVGAANIALVTDAMAATGMADGVYQLGTQRVSVADGVARLADGGSIAGGTAHLLDVVRTTVAHGVPLADAVLSASLVPAEVIGHRGVGRAFGALRPGYQADLLVTDRELRPVQV
ncbi:MAG TPA: amidohydrolase family protein [Actinotalea caeni]|uniref:N-acetylglucosamine-6-phosphate deacetylase n=1 Tax=Actinotalea caeni TaxID=1348467 RepID=UPI0012E224B6|nr:amidohydrolase family protein [Actinotalea caeni]HLV57220.1 amidohydrolase family protein [Actinotalea caeni]